MGRYLVSVQYGEWVFRVGSSVGGRVFVLHAWRRNQGTLPSSDGARDGGIVRAICRTYSKSSSNIKSENPFPLPNPRTYHTSGLLYISRKNKFRVILHAATYPPIIIL